jgi:metal-responsive CopG/Arc/MetJ family transcriptional regulator
MGASGMTTISFPAGLYTEVERVAQHLERTVSELLSDVVGRYLAEQRWRELQCYGQSRVRALGIEEGDLERLISESREERGE